MSQQALLVELTGKDVSKESDITLYAEMVGAYQHDDEIAFKSRLQSLMTRFPQSSYADNALFLAGRMAVDHSNYAEAVKYFARVEKDYPRSNKVVAAKFAKAMTYKKMNLGEFAMRNLKEVRDRYPGSPEFFPCRLRIKDDKVKHNSQGCWCDEQKILYNVIYCFLCADRTGARGPSS